MTVFRHFLTAYHQSGRVVVAALDENDLWFPLLFRSEDERELCFAKGQMPNEALVFSQMRFRTPEFCFRRLFGDDESAMSMSRTDWTIAKYWQTRYLGHLSKEELRDRTADMIGLSLVLGTNNKIAADMKVGPDDVYITDPVWSRFNDTLEENRVRFGDPIPRSPELRDRVAAPRPLEEERLLHAHRLMDVLEGVGEFALVRFSDQAGYSRSFFEGQTRMRLASAQMNQDDLARQDNELEIELNPNPSRKDLPQGRRVVRHDDYFLWCATGPAPDESACMRLFHDFNADSCVVIPDCRGFFAEMDLTCKAHRPMRLLPDFGKVHYIDPLLETVTSSMVPMAKHFRFSYQKEVRFICRVDGPVTHDHFFVQLPCLKRYGATYIGPE